ncbi:MAG: AraC family transcriptional regulator [Gemmatimonadota bacterium]|nr:AraC family transcriptional regulator [Gemmatimonadota bacterium]
MATPNNPRAVPISLGSPRFVSTESGGFTATDIWFPPDLELPTHTHDKAVLAVTLAGSITATLPGRRLESPKASFWTEPAGESHGNRVGPKGARVLALQPTAERVESLGGVGRWLDGVHLRRDARIHSLAHRLQAEVGVESGCAPLMVESLALEIIASGFRGRQVRERVRPPFLERAVALIHARFREPLTLTEIAEEAGVHPAHLTRTFRRYEGRSIGEAVRDAKVQWAAEQILMTDVSLSQIAHEAGYADQSHMSRWILRQYGMTPGALRRRGPGSRGRA